MKYSISNDSLSECKSSILNTSLNEFLSSFSNGSGLIYQFSSPLDESFNNFTTHALFVPTLINIANTSLQIQNVYNIINNKDNVIIKRKSFISLKWKPNIAWGLIISSMFLTSVIFLNRKSEFIYFQF